MSLTNLLLLLGGSAFGGAVIGYVFRWLLVLSRKGSIEVEIRQILFTAKEEAAQVLLRAEEESKTKLLAADELVKEKEEKVLRAEERVFKREESLDKKQIELDKEVEVVKGKIEEVKQYKDKAEAMVAARADELAKVAGLSKEQAKEQLYAELEREQSDDMMMRAAKLERDGMERLERRAREILTTAIHRLGNSVASDTMATAITIPNDDLKGKIIGKEGRNIKALERATGVEVIIDDTPGSIILSSYDPIRRAIARVAIENLIIDGRIQPAKIEMSHIAGMLAEELGANVQVARAGALLHDIGKALDHEVQGTHVEIGRRILQKFGVQEEVIKAMQAHHEEYPYETPESMIVQVADAISGGRPGARRDSVEQYIKRLADIEGIANSFAGVEKSYAISAGREVRVFVKPEEMTDFQARELARNIALRIENELKYPGEIKVAVFRETRAIEFAR